MALCIPRHLVDRQKEEMVISMLSFKIGEDKFQFQTGPFGQTPTVEPIPFFLVTKEVVYLPLFFAKKLMKKEIEDKKLSLPQHPDLNFVFTKELFQHQLPIAQEAFQKLQENQVVLLNLFTGFGKTIMGAYLSAKLKKRTLVLSTQSILPKQWEETFTTFTDAKVEVYDGSKKKFPSPDSSIVICTSGVLKNLPEDIRKSFGTVLLDEVHSFCTRTRIYTVLDVEPTYLIAETATFERPDGGEIMMRSVIGYNDVIVPLKKNFNVYAVETGVTPTIVLNRQGKMDWSKFVSSLVQDQYRNDLIVRWIMKNLNRKILVLTDRKEMIEQISCRLEEKGLEHDFLFGNKKKYKDTKILLGTWAKIGVGFDEKNACENFSGMRIDLVFLLFSTKQQWLVEQSVGRAFRSEMPAVVDFIDNHGTSKSHFKSREKWYKSRGGKVFKVSGLNPVDCV
jgi:superfamily II DNA or RNA helicase